MDAFEKVTRCTGFQWDEANSSKNWQKHKVSPAECEEVFLNQPLLVEEDAKLSDRDDRYYALGKTDRDRFLFIVFTIRSHSIRVISARNMNRKERKVYLSS